MAYYTEQQLSAITAQSNEVIRTRYRAKTAALQTKIFLSHSHKDQRLVDHVVTLLGTQGVTIYVDWKDGAMPTVTSPQTARMLKSRISDCSRFLLLATNNALTSKWVPWELGVADKANQMHRVAIWPVVNPPHQWIGNEYVGIYRYIERGSQGQPVVTDPETTKTQLLRDWLLS